MVQGILWKGIRIMSRRGKKSTGPRKSKAEMMRDMRSRVDHGSEFARAKRILMTGDDMVAAEFPIDVMLSLGMLASYSGEDPDLARERCDKAWQFAALAWSVYGTPTASCEGVYQRMVSGMADGSAGSGDDGEARVYALREALRKARAEFARIAPVQTSARNAKRSEIAEIETAINDAIGAKGRLSRRLAGMFAELRRPNEPRAMLTAVQNTVQYLRFPRLVILRPKADPNQALQNRVLGLVPRRADVREIELVRDGLQRLVDLDSARAKAA